METEGPDQIEEMNKAYRNTLQEARKFYQYCKELVIVPQDGLQKVVYDLGKKVNGPGVKSRIRMVRGIRSGMEIVDRLHIQGFF